MGVKIFLGSILLLVGATISGFAYWFFPVIDRFHQAMGGAPMKDPRGDWQQQLSDYLGFLPDNTLIRALIIAGVLCGYLVATTVATLIALRFKRRRDEREMELLSRARALHTYNAHR